MYGHLSAYENLRYFLSLAGTDTGRDELDAALDRVALQPEARDMRMQTYSKGMRQKVAIALAILRDTPILLLDEPTSGSRSRGDRRIQSAGAGSGRGGPDHSPGHSRCLRRLPCGRPHRPVAEWRTRRRPSAGLPAWTGSTPRRCMPPSPSTREHDHEQNIRDSTRRVAAVAEIAAGAVHLADLCRVADGHQHRHLTQDERGTSGTLRTAGTGGRNLSVPAGSPSTQNGALRALRFSRAPRRSR